MSSKKPAHAESADKAKHDEPSAPPPKDPPPEELNQGQVHPEAGHASGHEGHASVARIHMDQIDAVATPQGVVLFALTEGGEIWQLTSFAGHQEWTHILTPEAPPEEA